MVVDIFKEACKKDECLFLACESCLVRWFVGGSLVLDVSDLRQRASKCQSYQRDELQGMNM